MNKDFSSYLKDFFQIYLPETRKLSKQTIMTYKYCFIKLFNFFSQKKNVKPDNISLDMFNVELIEEFINWLLNDENNTENTINNRLSIIKTFFKFVSIHNVEYLNLYASLKNISPLKVKEKIVEYLPIDEIKLLFSIFDSQNKKELKELSILTLLYESAIRVSELCNLKLEDLDFSVNSTITIINGKGNKSRIVPISNDVARILQKYINTIEINKTDYLFKNHNNLQYTRWGINYIIQKNIKKVEELYKTEFKIKVTPHKFRHSKAMHMLDAGVSLSSIERILGHSSIKSTEIYAKASPKKLEEAIIANSQAIKVKRKYSKNKENNLLEWLKSEL